MEFKSKKIGVIVAMPEEMFHLKDFFPSLEIISNKPFETYKLVNAEVYFIISGIGKVNAAVAASILITNYEVSLIINVGTSAALDAALSVADVVVSNKAIYFDVDNRISGHKFGQLPKMPIYYQSQLFEDIVSNYYVASGDSFLTDSEKITTQLFEVINSSFIIDMEGAAVAQACHIHNTPFLLIKGISDIVNVNSLTESRQNRTTVMQNIGLSAKTILNNILQS